MTTFTLSLLILSSVAVSVQALGLYALAKKKLVPCLTLFIVSAILANTQNLIVATTTEAGVGVLPFTLLGCWQILTSSYGLYNEYKIRDDSKRSS
jgi:hypothetical protein